MSIFEFLLGREHLFDLAQEFLKLRMEFFQAMRYLDLVRHELCEVVSRE